MGMVTIERLLEMTSPVLIAPLTASGFAAPAATEAGNPGFRVSWPLPGPGAPALIWQLMAF